MSVAIKGGKGRFDYREVSVTLKTDIMLLTFRVEEGTTRYAVLEAGKGKKRASAGWAPTGSS